MMENGNIKEEFYKLVKDKGYASFRAFCEDVNIAPGNLHSNLTGRFELSINRAFTLANKLEVPIDSILDIFYPDKMKENSNYQL